MFDTTSLPENLQQLIDAASLCPLGPGDPNLAVRDELEGLGSDSLGLPVHDREMAACCVSGLWLLHNFLDESHTLSQDIPSAEGSYWHGIMHRREPDFSNAKYWFRRVGEHPVFEALPNRAAEVAAIIPAAARDLSPLSERWDAMHFIDLCEQAYRSPDSELNLACRQLAESEWKLLFQYCLSRAT